MEGEYGHGREDGPPELSFTGRTVTADVDNSHLYFLRERTGLGMSVGMRAALTKVLCRLLDCVALTCDAPMGQLCFLTSDTTWIRKTAPSSTEPAPIDVIVTSAMLQLDYSPQTDGLTDRRMDRRRRDQMTFRFFDLVNGAFANVPTRHRCAFPLYDTGRTTTARRCGSPRTAD
ncbi:hypothetical protein EVAR_54808_1 [Eumeta japonica]|uniref:Uncharacterized protein n=1 Tax=Eumeta variegata TaxID=151549 RepID=A0A4C1Y4B6_EUMVA|nr:hypothetical protein EVAR_54808_1 [Eumeta japonica]